MLSNGTATTYEEWLGALDLATMWSFKSVSLLILIIYSLTLVSLTVFSDSSEIYLPFISSEYAEGYHRDYPACQEVPHQRMAAGVIHYVGSTTRAYD